MYIDKHEVKVKEINEDDLGQLRINLNMIIYVRDGTSFKNVISSAIDKLIKTTDLYFACHPIRSKGEVGFDQIAAFEILM